MIVLSYGEVPVKAEGSFETLSTANGPTEILFRSVARLQRFHPGEKVDSLAESNIIEHT